LILKNYGLKNITCQQDADKEDFTTKFGTIKYHIVLFSIGYPYFRNGVFFNLKYILHPMD
jgi:hypothetical protein